jgi:very-short-patch-repair endonuclease
MFKRKPTNSFKNIDTSELIKAMKYLREVTGWMKPEDFYDLSRKDFATYDLVGLIRRASFADSIVELNPHMTFDKSKFNRHKTEELVKTILKKLGFNHLVSQIIYKSSYGGNFRMDIFIPSLRLYIEIDGDQHFKGRLECFQKMGWKVNVLRDVFKMKEALKNGMSVLRVIQMECWNGNKEWFEAQILPHIKHYEIPNVIYITTSDKYKDVYCDHKIYMENNICEDDLYI